MKQSAYRVLLGAVTAVALPLLGLTSCQNDFDTPALTSPEASLTANTSLLELKEAFWSNDANYIDTVGLTATGEHIVVKGRVVSNDADGNIYKSLVIQDGTAALAMSINANSLYNTYRVGQEVVIDVTGMYIGKYSSLQQLGFPDYSVSYGWQATFMPLEFFKQHVQLNGLPEPEKVDTLNITIPQLGNSASVLQQMQSRLVRINNVHFEEGGRTSFCSAHKVNTNRNLLDQDGNTLVVRTSGYARFWSEMLPAGEFDIVGILSYNGSGSSANWQLLLRSMDDILNIGNPTLPVGTETNPYTVEQAVALEAAQQPAMGWVAGYIVGAVSGGVENVGSASDIQWEAPFDMNNTLIIGATPSTRSLDEALLIRLPQGSPLRNYGNLRDNPDNLGQRIMVYGTLAPDMGTFAVTGNKGTLSEFTIDGVDTSGESIPNGDGTQAKPYSPTQVQGMNPTSTSAAVQSGVWVRGFIVGWVNTDVQTYACEESCNFSVPATKATNVLLATTPDEKDFNKCISLNLPTGNIRSAINLQDNPQNLGATLTIKGDVMKYVGIPGVKNPTEFTISGAGDTPTPPGPTPTGTVVVRPATELTAGKQYVMVYNGQISVPIKESYTYGYLYVEDPVATSGSTFTTNSVNLLTLGGSTGAWTLQDSYGRYLAMDDVDAHKSFQLYTSTTGNPGTFWTITLSSGSAMTMTNNLRTGFTVRWVANFKNFAPGQTETDPLPLLYEVTDGTGGGDDPTPPTPGGEGAGTADSPYTVADLFTVYNSGATATGVWATGYIVGSVDGASITAGAHFSTESASGTNLLLAPTAGCTDLSQCVPVQLPVGDVRSALNLKDNPSNLGKRVNLQGNVEKYFNVCGFKSVTAFTFP